MGNYKINHPGIYQIQSEIKPERFYIGSAVSINKRWNVHLCQLRKNAHCSKKLQRHYNKYGESDLQFSIIIRCEKGNLVRTEQYFLDLNFPYFNNNLFANSNLGVKFPNRKRHSEETRLKMSLSRIGTHPSEETRRKQVAIRIAKHRNIVGEVSIAVLQFDKDMNFIKEYETTNIAAQEVGLKVHTIGVCLSGQNKTAGNYIWKYKQEGGMSIE